MENYIYIIETPMWKSVMIRDNQLWLSAYKLRSVEKFERAVQKTGITKSTKIIHLDTIRHISFNEASNFTKITYVNDKNKEKKLNMDFKGEEASNQFGHFLGEKLELLKEEKQEKPILPLLKNIFFIALTLGGTYFFAGFENTAEITESASTRNRGKAELIKSIIDTVGPNGLMAIGGAIALFIGYKAYKRYTNPANEIIYSK